MSIFNLSGQEPVQQEPVAQNANLPTEGAVNPTESLSPSGVGADNKQPMIVLDGPLGHLYTQALNVAYAKEDTGTMSLAYQTYRNSVKEADHVDKDGTYVFVADGEKMDGPALVGATNDIQLAVGGKVFKNHLLVMEHHGVPNPKAQLLVEFAKGLGVRVIEKRSFSQESMKMALESFGHTFQA